MILETCLLTDEEKASAAAICVVCGADFVKTSTGFSTGGATIKDVELLSAVAGSRGLGVKASGGVRTRKDAEAMVDAGATRLGASKGVAICTDAAAAAAVVLGEY